MDLRKGQITIGELLADPVSRGVLERRFPHVVGRPIVAASAQLTLEKAMRLATPFVTRRAIEETRAELRRL